MKRRKRSRERLLLSSSSMWIQSGDASFRYEVERIENTQEICNQSGGQRVGES